MDRLETQRLEIDDLRKTTRDLVALTTLPAIWGDLPPGAIIDSLAGVLRKTLELDLAYVCLPALGDASALEAVRCALPDRQAAMLRVARAAVGGTAPAGDPDLRVTTVRFGNGTELGTIVVAAQRPDFPNENERLLLGVATNQATVVLQRSLAAQALERSQSRFLALADAAPAMLWVTESDGRFSFLSRAWYEFTAQSANDGLALGWTGVVHPDERADAALAFRDATTRQVPFSSEYRIPHADGSCRWVIATGRPRFAADGAFLGFVGNVLDISDHKQTEQSLHDTRGMLAAVFDALPVGVGVADQAGKILIANQEMLQYLPTGVMPSLDEARHARWTGHGADGRPYAREDFPGARALRGERVVPGVEMRYTGDDGREIWTQVASVPLTDREGRPRGQVSVVNNIDDHKRTEAALRLAESRQRALFDEVTRSNRNLSEFLAVLAHELRNPLAPILTGLEIMRMRADSTETVTHVRGIIERQVRQLSHLINDLLDIARVTNGKVDIRMAPVDLKAIVAAAVETSLPLIETGGHAFGMTMHEAALPVQADATRIAQVVGNLLTNAAKYTPHGGTISLDIGRDGDEAVITVTDTGIGIPADDLESVFDMFSQVGRNMAHAQGGLGIGLSLVRQLVGLHGGSVTAASEGAGKGSTFVVRLPLDLAAGAPGVAPDASEAVSATSKTYRILVTDDNADAAQTLSSLLEMRGHDVRVAHDGRGALALAYAFRPEVVFLDIGLPDMSGHDVARQLRTVDGMATIVIVAVSGWGTKDDLARSSAAGFDAHFTKPVPPARVNSFLDALP